MYIAFNKKGNPMDIKICENASGFVLSVNSDGSNYWLVCYHDGNEKVQCSEYDLLMANAD